MIYLDYASATPVRKDVMQVILPYFTEYYANPSSMHGAGRKAREAVEDARNTIKAILHASEQDKIIFTSGGTESINIALQGVKKGHIITSAIEHKAVLETCKTLEKKGYSVTYIPVDKNGLVNVKYVQKAIRKNTILISIMYLNNEIGTVQPIQKIAKIAKKQGILFHTDACQVSCYFSLDVQKLGVDLLTLNASKCYGPKGVGLLYVKKGTKLTPIIYGGGQESGVRSGTENVPGIVGFAKALEVAQKERMKEIERVQTLRDFFVNELHSKIKNIRINGTTTAPHIINISFLEIDAETFLNYLNQDKIYASSGSACTTNHVEVSHVLTAIGVSEKDARSSIRFSFGRWTTKKQLRDVIRTIKKVTSVLSKL